MINLDKSIPAYPTVRRSTYIAGNWELALPDGACHAFRTEALATVAQRIACDADATLLDALLDALAEEEDAVASNPHQR